MTRLATVLRRHRLMEDIGIREVAKDIGFSAATLSRIERGHPPDAHNLVKILVWLMKEGQ